MGRRRQAPSTVVTVNINDRILEALLSVAADPLKKEKIRYGVLTALVNHTLAKWMVEHVKDHRVPGHLMNDPLMSLLSKESVNDADLSDLGSDMEAGEPHDAGGNVDRVK